MKSSRNHPNAECIMNEDKPRSCSAGDQSSAAQQMSGADSAANEAKRNGGGEDLLIDPPEKHQAAPDSDETKKADELYSAHTLWQKRLIVSLGASVGWFSTSSSFIFFPIIPFLARDLRESTECINLTVTSYLVASGVFPSIVSGLSDVYGRKPVFVTALGAYVAVNIGLALQRSFAVLLGLRLLQAAAISASFAFSYGVLGDITTSTERGEYIGLMSIFLNTPASVAPLISGLLLIRWSWPATFWFLAIASGTVLLAIVFFFPETCRNVAGDGTRRTKWQHSVIIPWLKPPRSREPAKSSTADKNAKKTVARKMITPLDLLKIFRNRATTISIVCYGIFYAMYSCLQASLSTIFVDQYGVSGLTTGLLYLPFGIATIFASVLTGMLMDREYAKVAKRLGLDPDKRRQHDLTDFPIERVRLSLSKYAVVLCVPCIVGYGWALQHHAHMAVPLVLQFCIGFTNQVNFTTLNGLITDLHPDRSATVQAACNLFRCEFAAGMLALLDVMLRKLRPGWCFTVIAIMQAIAFPALWAVERNGLAWRKSGKQESIGKK